MSCLGSHKAKDTGRSYWSCLENNAVGDQAAHWEEGPEPRCSHLLDGGGGGAALWQQHSQHTEGLPAPFPT